MTYIEDLLKEAWNRVKEPVFIYDKNGTVLFFNEAFIRLIGGAPSSFLSAAPPLLVKQFWEGETAPGASMEEFSAKFRASDKSLLSVKLTIEELSSGLRLARVLAALSQTDSAEFFHEQRLETLGLLAGGIAHDFNNALTGILGHVSYLKTVLPTVGPHIESISAIENGAKKSSFMTQQILNFSRVDAYDDVASLDLSQVIVRTCRLLRGAISPEYQFSWKIPDEPVMVFLAEAKIGQVLANLVINARDALSPNGKIQVILEPVVDEETVRACFPEYDPSQKYAALTVSDNGKGMAQEVQARAFDPFFSTKKSAGTGLGLTTVRTLVTRFRGSVDIESSPGTGTTVRVFFPLEQQNESDSQHDSFEEQLVGGTERILVVDDEYPVRNIVTVSLEHLGYSVVGVESGMKAVEILRSDPHAIDLVVLDMLMPQMSGEETFYQLRKIRPTLSVLIMSGFASEDSVRRITREGGKGFIQKPFTVSDLAKKVRESLG